MTTTLPFRSVLCRNPNSTTFLKRIGYPYTQVINLTFTREVSK